MSSAGKRIGTPAKFKFQTDPLPLTGIGLAFVGGGGDGGFGNGCRVVSVGVVFVNVPVRYPHNVPVNVFSSGGIWIPLYASQQIVHTHIAAKNAAVVVITVMGV